MKTIQPFFQKKYDEDLIQEDKILETAIEPVVIGLVMIYLLINLTTGFFIDNISILIYFFLFAPFLAELGSSYILLSTRSKQKSRIASVFANGFTSIGWLYLYFADKWYHAQKLWLIGGFVDGTIFKWIMLGGAEFPFLIAVYTGILYIQVKQIQKAELKKTSSETLDIHI